jgi:hypothetical protein
MSDNKCSLRTLNHLCDQGYFDYTRKDSQYIDLAATHLNGDHATIGRALQGFRTNDRFPSFGPQWLRAHLRPGQKPSPKETDLSLLLELKTENDDSEFYEYDDVHRDGSFNFSIVYKRSLVALASFDPVDGKFQCQQLQGVCKDNGPMLAPYQWTDALLAFAEDWAKHSGIASVGIQGAKNNEWVRCGHLPIERAQKIYDSAATRRGFLALPTGNYEKSLTQQN